MNSEKLLKLGFDKLEKFRTLTQNWNGYQADPIEPETIDFIKSILSDLVITPEIFPLASGGIQIEFEKSNGYYLEFEIYNTEDIKYFIQTGDSKEIEGKTQKSLSGINEIISKWDREY